MSFRIASWKLPMCIGVQIPCARVRPSASRSAVEKSSESRTIPEWAVRIRVRAMSSAMVSKQLLRSSSWNGSMVWDTDFMRVRTPIRRSPAPGGGRQLDDNVAETVEARGAVRGHDAGPLVLLDDEGAGPGLGAEPPPADDRRCRRALPLARSTRRGRVSGPAREAGSNGAGSTMPAGRRVPTSRRFTISTGNSPENAWPYRARCSASKRSHSSDTAFGSRRPFPTSPKGTVSS